MSLGVNVKKGRATESIAESTQDVSRSEYIFSRVRDPNENVVEVKWWDEKYGKKSHPCTEMYMHMQYLVFLKKGNIYVESIK